MKRVQTAQLLRLSRVIRIQLLHFDTELLV
jgi:hypothetical protein